jgi:hypothetical protein
MDAGRADAYLPAAPDDSHLRAATQIKCEIEWRRRLKLYRVGIVFGKIVAHDLEQRKGGAFTPPSFFA